MFSELVKFCLTSQCQRSKTLVTGLTAAVTPPPPASPLADRQWRVVLSRSKEKPPSDPEVALFVQHLLAWHEERDWRFLLDFTHKKATLAHKPCHILTWLDLRSSDLWSLMPAERKAIVSRLAMPPKAKRALLARVQPRSEKRKEQ